MKARDNAALARDTRWKLPSLNRLGYGEMWRELEHIQNDLYEMRYFVEEGDETFTNAMNGDDEEEWEFRMAFSELEGEAEDIREMFQSWDKKTFVLLMSQKELKELYDENPDYTTCRLYDDCTVALIGQGYNFGVNGFDVYEMDAFGLSNSEAKWAAEDAEKRLLRLTKEKLVRTVGQAVSIMLRFQAFYCHYILLTQTFEQIRGANLSVLKTIKEIDEAYEIIAKEMETNKRIGFGYTIYSDRARDAEARIDRLAEELPDRLWVE